MDLNYIFYLFAEYYFSLYVTLFYFYFIIIVTIAVAVIIIKAILNSNYLPY
jgi:hypothetical protein